ncbi:MAG: hypothetical protein LLF76_07860 [Planctomycetaceae bacterium]|nr:hypothetical protein [Planctomycetaceae bacterium]
MSGKLSKYLAVIFLTLLIWWWAFSLQLQPVSLTGTLEKLPTADPSLLVTFTGPSTNAPQRLIVLRALNFRGAPSKIAELRQRMRLPQNNPNRERLNFYYTPQEPGTYVLDVPDYLQKTTKMAELALTLESCEPSQVTVNVERLEEKRLSVQVVDENGLIRGANAEPAWVNVYVRPSYNEPAIVKLSAQQLQTARERPITVKPYVDMGVAGIVRDAEESVTVTLQSVQLLQSKPFQPQTIGFIISPELAGKYSIQLANEADLKSRVQLRVSEAAFAEYQKRAYHLLIEVRPGDERLPEIPPRPVIYNFPREYVAKGEIELVESTTEKTAVFKLVPVNPAQIP